MTNLFNLMCAECYLCDACLKFGDSIDGECPCVASREAQNEVASESLLVEEAILNSAPVGVQAMGVTEGAARPEQEASLECVTHSDCHSSYYCNNVHGS